LKNKAGIVSPEKCIDKLKEHYNIASTLIVLKSDYNSDVIDLDNLDNPLTSDSVNFKVYDPNTKEELNTTICSNDAPIKIKTKIKATQLLNLTYYNQMINASIDVYNPSAPAFNDVCVVHIDTDTGFDSTVNWRRTHYFQNLSAFCEGANCTYAGIDEDDYISCECSSIEPEEVVNSDFNSYLLGQFSVWNFEVFLCGKQIAEVKHYLFI
jgi:hypothetical protein